MLELKDEVVLLWLLVLAGAYWLHFSWQRQRADLVPGDGDSPPEQAATDETLPYRKKWQLLSLAERGFYDVLRQAAGTRYLVFAKMRLLDFLWVPENVKGRQRYMDRVMSHRVDFALCHADSLAPALVIELVDACDPIRENQIRDTFEDQVLRTAGIPILRLPIGNEYGHHELRRCIEEAMSRPGLVTRADRTPVAYVHSPAH